jgi:hypothetical protein
LQDDPEFADAIDCMVSYFYSATYDVSKYNSSQALLHAQVVMLADKYDCASLYKLARTSFASAVMFAGSNEWADIATLIYEYATTDVPDHVELRSLLVAAVPRQSAASTLFFRNENIVKLLRSNADLGADVLLSRIQRIDPSDPGDRIFLCDRCHYGHVGSPDCSTLKSRNIDLGGMFGSKNVCPECGEQDGVVVKRHTCRVMDCQTFPCASCGGVHTASPYPEDLPSAP